MKHAIKGRKLNRTTPHRKALLMNLSNALIKNESIKTTLPKAKELKPFVEKIINIGKTDSLANRRRILSILQDKLVVKKIFEDISVRVKNRKGGYTRIMKFGFRTGDKAPMAIIELVDKSDQVNSNLENDKVKIEKTKQSNNQN